MMEPRPEMTECSSMVTMRLCVRRRSQSRSASRGLTKTGVEDSGIDSGGFELFFDLQSGIVHMPEADQQNVFAFGKDFPAP